jgi:putative endonuclease
MPSEALAKEGGFMWYVYLLESIAFPGQRYIGLTSNIDRRLAEHNAGKSLHTSKSVPWQLVTYIVFSNEEKAISFERYLKSGSGHAFARKRFW